MLNLPWNWRTIRRAVLAREEPACPFCEARHGFKDSDCEATVSEAQVDRRAGWGGDPLLFPNEDLPR